MDIRLIRVFRTVVKCGGLAASELELNIGRSTISKHISDLELRLGMTLCHRGPGGFRLTAEGQKVLEAADRLLKSLEGFQVEVDDIHRTLVGTLHVAMFDRSTTNPKARLDLALRRFDALAPDVALDVKLAPPNQIEAQVIEGALDVGIVPVYRHSVSLTYAILYAEEMTLYCGKGHPLFEQATSDVDLAGFKYAGFSFNSPNMEAGKRLGLTRAASVQDEDSLALLIQSGCYLGFLADHVAAEFLSRGQVWPVAPERSHYVTTFAAITRKSAAPDRKAEAFLTCLREAHA
ncbi:MAG: LysR family transcriptional regulator [Pseudomonadota bacterium]